MRSAASTIEGKRSAQLLPLRVKQRTRSPSRRTMGRYPSCLISWTQSDPDGGLVVLVGWHGLIKPEGKIMAGGRAMASRFNAPVA